MRKLLTTFALLVCAVLPVAASADPVQSTVTLSNVQCKDGSLSYRWEVLPDEIDGIPDYPFLGNIVYSLDGPSRRGAEQSPLTGYDGPAFANLKPGTYTFTATYAGDDSRLPSAPFSVQVTCPPPLTNPPAYSLTIEPYPTNAVTFNLKGRCRDTDTAKVTWTGRSLVPGAKPTRYVRNPCTAVSLGTDFEKGKVTHQGALEITTHDFTVSFKTKGAHKSWRFRAVERYYPGRSIPESDFDNYVNVCLDKSYHIYAKGGQLWCDTPVGLSRTIKRIS
jgi:hypothetical protein